MYRAATVALLLVLAGCQTPGVQVGTESATTDGDAGPVESASPNGPEVDDGDAATSDGETSQSPDGGAAVAPPDPDGDPLGWENGYWHNESVAVTTGDGLNESERTAVLSRAMARVELVRDLEFEATVPLEVVSRSAYRNGSGGNYSAALQRFDNAKFEALFLVGEANGSVETQEEARAGSVLGYYSPAADAIVVVSDSETPTLDGEVTLAHELVHALQDQHFDIGNGSVRTRDAYQGRNGLIEGDASFTERRYQERCGREWRCLRSAERGNGTQSEDGGTQSEGDGGAQSERGAAGHFGIQFMEYFPYSDGHEFVAHRHDRGGWNAVDDAYADVPDGSPEVIYPERYPGWEPVEVSLADRSGDAWDRVRPPDRPDYAVPGQSAIAAAFAYTLTDDYERAAVVRPTDVINYRADGTVSRTDPFDYDVAPAAGWTGGRMHVYQRGNASAYVWRTRWEDEREAGEFARAWGSLLTHWGGERVADGQWVIPEGPFADAFAIRQDGETVTVVNAPERAGLEAVHSA